MSETTLQQVITDFVDFYIEVSPDNKTGQWDAGAALDRINSGDCGTASVAIGWVWNHLSGDEVIYHDNFNHGYIEVNGRFYDTLVPEGVDSHAEMFQYKPKNVINHVRGDVSVQHCQFLRVDDFGIQMVREFAKRWGAPDYPLRSYKELGEVSVADLKKAIRSFESIIPHLEEKGSFFLNEIVGCRDTFTKVLNTVEDK